VSASVAGEVEASRAICVLLISSPELTLAAQVEQKPCLPMTLEYGSIPLAELLVTRRNQLFLADGQLP
jgi:hypothetical protein